MTSFKITNTRWIKQDVWNVQTFDNDRDRVVELMKDLIEGPLVVTSYHVVTFELLIFLRQINIAQIWMLRKI